MQDFDHELLFGLRLIEIFHVVGNLKDEELANVGDMCPVWFRATLGQARRWLLIAKIHHHAIANEIFACLNKCMLPQESLQNCGTRKQLLDTNLQWNITNSVDPPTANDPHLSAWNQKNYATPCWSCHKVASEMHTFFHPQEHSNLQFGERNSAAFHTAGDSSLAFSPWT